MAYYGNQYNADKNYANYKYPTAMPTAPYSQTPQPVPTMNEWQMKDQRYRALYNDYYYYDNRYIQRPNVTYGKPEDVPKGYMSAYYKSPTSHTPNPNGLNENSFTYNKSSLIIRNDTVDRNNESKNYGIGKINYLIMNRANPSQIPKTDFRIGVKLSKYNLKSIGVKDS